MNQERPDVQARFRKGRGTIDQSASILWILEKAGEFQKNMYFRFIDYSKAFACGSQLNVENSSRDGYHHLRNLYAGQEATLRTRHGTMDWFQIEKGVFVNLSICQFVN